MASSASASEQEMASAEPEIASSSSSEDESLALLKGRFFDEICKELKPKRNVIETRAISKNQVDELMMPVQDIRKPASRTYRYSQGRREWRRRQRFSCSMPGGHVGCMHACTYKTGWLRWEKFNGATGGFVVCKHNSQDHRNIPYIKRGIPGQTPQN